MHLEVVKLKYELWCSWLSSPMSRLWSWDSRFVDVDALQHTAAPGGVWSGLVGGIPWFQRLCRPSHSRFGSDSDSWRSGGHGGSPLCRPARVRGIWFGRMGWAEMRHMYWRADRIRNRRLYSGGETGRECRGAETGGKCWGQAVWRRRWVTRGFFVDVEVQLWGGFPKPWPCFLHLAVIFVRAKVLDLYHMQ